MTTANTHFTSRYPAGLIALAVGAFGIGLTEFVIMGLLPEVSADLAVGLPAAGLLISGYALGVVVGAPVLTLLTQRGPPRRTLLGLMLVFIAGNLFCALAADYTQLMLARVVTALAHGTFFGVGAVAATRLVSPDRGASAIAIMFTGLTVANVLGVPLGTWLGQVAGWRSTFYAVAITGVVAWLAIRWFLPVQSQMAGDDAPRGRLFTGPVVLGLAMTVLGFGGSFALLTFISPLLTDVGGFRTNQIPPLLMLFGLGVVAGNLLGGYLADRFPRATLPSSLLILTLALLALWWTLPIPALAVVNVLVLGIAAFMTCAPLQMWVMSRVSGSAGVLASSLNIAAFNLGNALGAALAGQALVYGGLMSVPWVAAAMPLLAIPLCFWGLYLERRSTQATQATQAAQPTQASRTSLS